MYNVRRIINIDTNLLLQDRPRRDYTILLRDLGNTQWHPSTLYPELLVRQLKIHLQKREQSSEKQKANRDGILTVITPTQVLNFLTCESNVDQIPRVQIVNYTLYESVRKIYAKIYLWVHSAFICCHINLFRRMKTTRF